MSIFSVIGTTIETGAVSYATSASAALCSYLAPFAILLTTLWVTLYGYATMRGETQSPIMGFGWRFTKMGLILSLATSASAYQADLMALVNAAITEISSVMMRVSPGAQFCAASAGNPYQLLDCYSDAGDAMFQGFQAQLNQMSSFDIVGAVSIIFFSFVAGIGLVAFQLIMAVEIILCRIELQLLFAVGPLFVFAWAFEPTKKYFDGWQSAIVRLGLTNVFVFGFLALAMAVIQSLVGKILPNPAGIFSGEGWLNFLETSGLTIPTVAIGICLSFGILAAIGYKLPSIAGALSGCQASGGFFGAMVGNAIGKAVVGHVFAPPGPSTPNRGGSIRQGGSGSSSQGGSGKAYAFQKAAAYGRQRASSRNN